MDVSDGLVQDLGHLCRAAGCAAVLRAAEVPLSPAARALVTADPALLALCLTGGDDYELLFAAAPGAEAAVRDRAAEVGTAVTRIGRFAPGASAVQVLDAALAPMPLPQGGWSHF
jgi:thiamine-monophosphate kinase